MGNLAIHGGKRIREKGFSKRRTIREDEKKAILNILDEGELSGFFGSPGKYFLGGERVKEFEKDWAQRYGYKHAISINSWTTGLMVSVGAAGIGPGDEVICAPYSMSATSTSLLFYGAIPVFTDIEDDYFCIDPKKIEEKITPRTKAIMLVHLFGHPAAMDEINAIAKKHNLKVIEDAAHAPGAKYKGQYVGGMKDLGGFSFNYHKHIHCGEGGVIVTNDDDLAFRCQLIRNHGENLIESEGIQDISNVMGSNYRMTELQAAIAKVQAGRLDEYVEHRNVLANFLREKMGNIDGLTLPKIQSDCTHSFYVYALKVDEDKLGISRKNLVNAINAEFPTPEIWEQTPAVEGYVKPLYLNPMYQRKIAMGPKGFPFNYNEGVEYNYNKGICPVVEKMFDEELFLLPIIREAVDTEDLNDFVLAVEKILDNKSEFQN